MKVPVTINVNGRPHQREVEPRLLLVHFLRDVIGLTGTKIGCDTSQCGSCTVLLDGVSVKRVHVPRGAGRRCGGDDDRRTGDQRRAERAAGSLLGQARPAVRVLHAGHGLRGAVRSAAQSESDAPRRSGTGSKATVPLHGLSEHRARRGRGGRRRERGHERHSLSRLRFRDSPPRRSTAPHRHRALHRRYRRCRAWRTPQSCAARTATRGFARSTRGRAKAAPGVVAVFTSADAEGALQPIPCAWLVPNSELKIAPYRAMAKDVVRYVGDAVAVVVAESAHAGLRRARSDRRRLRTAARPSSIRRRRGDGRAAAACRGARQHRVSLDRCRRRRRCRLQERRGRRPRSNHPAAADSDRDGDARRRRAVRSRHWRADAVEYDAESPHRALHHVARHRRARRTAARDRAGSRRRVRQQDRADPGRLHHDVLRDEAWAAGEVAGNALRELSVDDARPRSRAGGRAGGDERRTRPGICAAPCGRAWAPTSRLRRPAFRRFFTA